MPVIVFHLRKVRLVIHILDKRSGILLFDNDRMAPKNRIAVDAVLFRDSYPVIQGPAPKLSEWFFLHSASLMPRGTTMVYSRCIL